MARFLFLLFAAVSAAHPHTRWHALDGYTFQAYEREYGKVYASAEERE